MFKPSEKQFSFGLWALGALVVLIAVSVWWNTRQPGSAAFTAYSFFPVLGLSAFSLMWTHYIGGALIKFWDLDNKRFKMYFSATGWIVLGLILLHPGMFWFLLFRDGFGLPPASYLSVYTDTAARIALLLGSLSLGAFLAFELKRAFAGKPWWRYIEYLNIAAMGAIFYHALTLGGELNVTWFKYLWYFYGLTLVFAIVYSYRYKSGGTYEK